MKKVVDKKPVFSKKDIIFAVVMGTIIVTLLYVTQNCLDYSWQPGQSLFQVKWK